MHRLNTERDACGIGFVANAHGTATRAVVAAAVEALCRVQHRGAVAADALTGDGAGILAPLPTKIFSGAGVAMIFMDAASAPLVEEAALKEGLTNLQWRDVPCDDAALGTVALASRPIVAQLLFDCPDVGSDEAERRCYRARLRAERSGSDSGGRLYVASWSTRTVTYKALTAAVELANFYTDLASDDFQAAFAMFHQRYSTNTSPTWERAQPFRFLCHNGEINAIDGNLNWMRARQSDLGAGDLAPSELLMSAVDPSGSDSAILDNVMELLVRAGRDVRHAASMLVPPQWEHDETLAPDLRDFYRYHACVIEPWDGPAGLVFTDGTRVAACLDRNGLRPLRYQICDDGLVVVSSEVGTVDVDGHGSVKRGRLGPGEMICVDPTLGESIQTDAQAKATVASLRPWSEWTSKLRGSQAGEASARIPDLITERLVAFGYTKEERTVVIEPMAKAGKEATSSMGDDTSPAVMSAFQRNTFGYLKQRFAQVTNPPIDHLRERLVMSLRTLVGPRTPLLTEGPEACELMAYESFFVFEQALDDLFIEAPWDVAQLDATFNVNDGPDALEEALTRIAEEAQVAVGAGAGIVVISDARLSSLSAPVPSLLAVGAVHHRLLKAGLRTRASLVVDSGEPRETHHFACLLGYGADLICPRLVLASLAERAQSGFLDGLNVEVALSNYRHAIEDGVLKIMSKMGISTLDSYRGAQIFEAIGLGTDVVEKCLDGTYSTIWGIGFPDIGADCLKRHAAAFGERKAVLTSNGFIKFRPKGEFHQTNPEVVDALHEVVGAGTNRREADLERAAHALRKAVRGDDEDAYDTFAASVNDRPASTPRDLLEMISSAVPIPLEEVESAADICHRFSTGAISHGAISAEAHECLAIAMNMIGGKANTGEGGEAPERYQTIGTKRDSNCRIKQIASGRFGVTAEYCAHADELQIKMAQGSKPGEGGQLPGHKVTDEIARLRHTQPGVSLISPPPHHDIYSIEDLAQLIYDLKQVNSRADVSVKLVSTAGVGTIAAGVVKGLAEVVHIAGADGGTGASPLSSIKHAGMPWELGLAETQQVLCAENLRGRVRIRVDGGLKTGRDIVVAALLGADEFSFGTAALLAEGCIMVRTCHRDTCPVGIATQNPDLRAKFQGTPEMVAAYMFFVAGEARKLLASLGLRSISEAVGRVELLKQRSSGDVRTDSVDLSWLMSDARTHADAPRSFTGPIALQRPRSTLGAKIAQDADFAVRVGEELERHYPITNADRSIGAELGGEIGRRFGADVPPGVARLHFTGQAGQSFGAFLTSGIEFHLTGEANDYVGKSMNGGQIVITPPDNDAGDPVLIGNTVLYGATGGELYCAGAAGARFAVRNSGANAVVEGAGMHACEYMTGGWVVILGDVGPNLGAGMTGGQAFVYDPSGQIEHTINDELVFAARVNADQAEIVRDFVQRHAELTGSTRAAALLENWESAATAFWAVRPKTDVASIEAHQDGLVRDSDEEPQPAA